MSEWFITIGYEGQLATWLVASFLLYTLASQLAWQFQWLHASGYSPVDASGQQRVFDPYRGRNDRLVRLIGRLSNHPFYLWAVEVMRLVYYLGIPFLAAVNGLLAADLLGISGTHWADGKGAQGFLWEDWAQGLGLSTAAVLAVVGVWFVGRLVSRAVESTSVMQGMPGPYWQRLLEVLYDQIHWAFYRSGPILWLDDLYWGTFAGLALVFLEASFDPSLWWKLKSSETAGPPVIRLAIAWISALLFLSTQNLWLTTGVHLVLVGILGAKGTETGVYIHGDESAQ